MKYFFLLLFIASVIALPVGLIRSLKNEPKVASLMTTISPSPIIPTITVKPTESPIPTVTPSAKQRGILVKVINVVDGDTIKIETGETVRFIGIDSPESVDPRKPIQCYSKEATVKNEDLALGKTVELEKDVSEKDRYGRLLRYIWIGDQLINEILVREGFAYSSTYPPDVKYQNLFLEAQHLAREEKRGLWGDVCQNQAIVLPSARPISDGSYVCDCSKSCAKMSSCDEAQYQLNVCGCSRRDADGDGIACDADCQ